MTMHSGIVLSQASGRPMWAQIADQVKRHVATGDWPPGTEVPSIRGLAAELGISVITVKRAYAELEDDGIIATTQGKPSVVARKVPRLAQRVQQAELARLLAELVELAVLMGLTPKQLQAAIELELAKAGVKA